MEQKVSIATDKSSHFGKLGDGGVWNCSHLIPAPLFCWENNVQMNHRATINGFLRRHGLAGGVRHRGQPVVQQFHCCGLFIEHASPVMDHILGPLQSSRVVIFGAALVKFEGAPVGFAIYGNPCTVMLTCGKIPYPVGASDDSPANSIVVGMDPDWDYQCGWDHIGLLMFKAYAALVVEGVVAFVSGFVSPLTGLAGAAFDVAMEGVGTGVRVANQGLKDRAGTRDIGRRYQERMQRRRAAGETDFESARTAETRRGGAEGIAEGPAFGTPGDLGAGRASDYLFGTGPEEPER